MTGCEWAVFLKMKMSKVLIPSYRNSRPHFIFLKYDFIPQKHPKLVEIYVGYVVFVCIYVFVYMLCMDKHFI